MNKIWPILLMLSFSCASTLSSEDQCKNLKSCAEWVTGKTGVIHDLGKLEKRTLKVEKEMTLNEGDADFNFGFILSQNDFSRIRKENGTYQVINFRELKDYQFQTIKLEEIPGSFDYFAVEFNFTNMEKVKNAMLILKKYVGKNGRILAIANSTKVLAIDTGFQLQMLREMAKSLNK